MRLGIATLLVATLFACAAGGGDTTNSPDAITGVVQAEATTPSVINDNALRGKRLYLDGGRIVGTGVSCVDCHGDVVGSAFGLGKAANSPAAIDYAINAIPQMARARGRYSAQDLIELAAYIGEPNVASPDVRLLTSGAAANPYTSARLEFGVITLGAKSSTSKIRIVNAGQIALNIAALPTLAGPDTAQFELLATDCQAGLTLQFQQACELTIAFVPTGLPGPRSASVGITHDWVRGVDNVALIGSAAF
jgi:mono/diheme cytochrome c family protein